MASTSEFNMYGSMDTALSTLESPMVCTCKHEGTFGSEYRVDKDPTSKYTKPGMKCMSCIRKSLSLLKNEMEGLTPLPNFESISLYDIPEENDSVKMLDEDSPPQSTRRIPAQKIQNNNRIQQQPTPTSNNSSPHSSSSGVDDAMETITIARAIKHNGDREWKNNRVKGLQLYLQAGIRFLVSAGQHCNNHQHEKARQLYRETTSYFNFIYKLYVEKASKYQLHGYLALLGKAYCCYQNYMLTDGIIHLAHKALQQRQNDSMDSSTFRYIQVSFSIVRVFKYLKDIESYFGDSPMHQNLYNVTSHDIVTYMTKKLHEFETTHAELREV